MVIHVKYHEEKAQDSVEIVAFFEVGEINVYLGKWNLNYGQKKE